MLTEGEVIYIMNDFLRENCGSFQPRPFSLVFEGLISNLSLHNMLGKSERFFLP